MDDGREAMNGIDRELADALDVDVSPDFMARVRQRIASEPVPPPFWRGWRIVLPAVAAAALAMAAGLTVMSNRGASTPQRLSARTLALESLRPADGTPTRPVPAVAAAPARIIAARVPTVSTVARHEPEVLVPREEIEMYRRLIAAAQNVPHALVIESPPDIVSVGLISEITIDPIKIDLMVPPPVGGEGDRQ
jgi:hypothetical protein